MSAEQNDPPLHLPSSNNSSTAPPRVNRRLGYIKPQAQPFSKSARDRSSVMALGRIDHLQHHFARTKALHARSVPNPRSVRSNQGQHLAEDMSSPLENPQSLCEEEEEEEDSTTYNPASVPLPPSPVRREYVGSLGRDIDSKTLRKALESDLRTFSRLLSEYNLNLSTSENSPQADEQATLKLVDNLMICIRSARTYSTSIPSYQTVESSFSVFREDALDLLSYLRRILERDGSDGLSGEEMSAVTEWLQNVSDYLDNENPKVIEGAMSWINPDLWQDKEDERHCHFLNFYDPFVSSCGAFMDEEVLRDLSTGVRLCRIYNAIVRRSRKPFGLITRFHENTSIRYRVLENLRFWHTAIEYRLGLQLDEFNPNEVYEFTEAGRAQLHDAVTKFCRVAIQEMVETLDENVLDDREGNLTEDVDELQVKEICDSS